MKHSRELCNLISGLVFALILFMAMWIYYPGVHGPALLDDYSSLGALGNLNNSPDQAWDHVLGDNSGLLGRSVSMATFVAERLLADGSTATTKLVNIAIHLLNGLLLTGFLLLLTEGKKAPFASMAAVLFAGVWLLAPLQVSTTLYLVQRMAMLATTFSLLSMIFYVVWRRSLDKGVRYHLWLVPLVVSFLLGVFSKENAVVCIPLILLLEACWFQAKTVDGQLIPKLQRYTYGLILLGIAAVVILLVAFWSELAAKHGGRGFSLEERLMTQPRILWDYVHQFYVPDLRRLGIFHDDYTVSTSLYSPPSTLTAIISWCVVTALCLVVWGWPAGRRVAFGPLFFLAAHSIESTVWPLELYFEHRNYLPSIGLCILPFSLYLLFARKWREIGGPLLVWISVYLFYLMLQTSSQVQIWSSTPLLAIQHANGHPDSARANKVLATHLAGAGARQGALKYSERAYIAGTKKKAAGDEHHGDYVLRNLALSCIALDPLTVEEYTELGRLEPSRPLGEVATMSAVIKLRQADTCVGFDWGGFLDHLAFIYLQEFDTSLASANMWSALAMLANAEEHWEYAYEFNVRNLALAPGNIRGLLMQLHFTTALNKREEADKCIRQLQELQEAGKLNQGERDTLALYLEK